MNQLNENIELGPIGAVTTPPLHPHDVRHRLELRQAPGSQCGWENAVEDNPIGCEEDAYCLQNTAYSAVICCSTTDYPSGCTAFPTTCYDASDYSATCTGECLSDPRVGRCYSSPYAFCQTRIYPNSITLTNYACWSTPELITVYDYFTFNGATYTVTTDDPINIVGTDLSFSDYFPTGDSASASNAATTAASVPSTTTPSFAGSSPVTSHTPISSGAIVGIVVGTLTAVVVALGIILLYRYFRKRQELFVAGANPSMSSPQPTPTPAEPMRQFFSGPTIPEVSPNESASQVGGIHGSGVSYNPVQPPIHEQPFFSGNEQGSPPSFQQQHPGFHGLRGPQSTFSGPDTAFGSMPPVRAPDVHTP